MRKPLPRPRIRRALRRSGLATGVVTLVAVALIATPVAGATGTAPAAVPAAAADPQDLPEPFTAAATGLADVDVRESIAPTGAQRAAARQLGATVRWGRYGTPRSVLATQGLLGPRTDRSAVRTARGWLVRHADLLGLAPARLRPATLELVNDQRMSFSDGHAVLFRQTWGGLDSAVDGMVTVGVGAAGVAYVSSSLAKATETPSTDDLMAPAEAWLAAADDVDLDVSARDVDESARSAAGWTTFEVSGLAQPQQARLRALALPDGTVRPVFETNVVDARADETLAHTSYVDAADGTVLVRHNQVDNLSATAAAAPTNGQFSGAITATDCGPDHEFTVDADQESITVTAAAAIATNDIVVLLRHEGATVAASDTGTSPEAVVYSPATLEPGLYAARVCPFDDPTVPFTAPGDYAGTYATSDVEQPQPPESYPPIWQTYLANPALNFSPTAGAGPRANACWAGRPARALACSNPPGPLINLAARGPWDYDFTTNAPTETTAGNAALTAEAWTTPLSPGAFGQRPAQPDRTYDDPFVDTWNNQRCNPTTLVAGGNDILASVTNLFATHNRMHDYAYYLGFTEANYNLQQTNFGGAGLGQDPEIGNVQAGAITGGAPSYLGRDNANQITLQDGTPGITNQYLFQPIAGAFYSPCVDGDLDTSVIGHEYTHAITNRMVGGPDQNLSGFQAGSMGESWGDLVALEYLFSHHYSTGAPPWVEGPYVTGNRVTGIRNYALDRNPLQYGDIGYDVTGPEVHADGEVWSAVMFDVRQALVDKWDAAFDYDDRALQRSCAQGLSHRSGPRTPLDPGSCPGNRRWVALMFDSFLLQQPATSMLDARDALVAADLLRFDGANRAAIWRAFASDGMGSDASTTDTEDGQPRPGYAAPFNAEGTLQVRAVDPAGDPVQGRLMVGSYEARATPAADTVPGTPRNASLPMVPGTYRLTFAADGYGISHATAQITAGQTTRKTLRLRPNLASVNGGATLAGATAGSLNAGSLLDDTESTNWGGITTGTGVDTSHPFVQVDLAGGAHLLSTVRVSAMLSPAAADDEDQDSGSRFTAVRRFAIEVCVQSAGRDCSSTAPSGAGAAYQRIYTSPAGAFPGSAPRPLAPQLLLRGFDVPDRQATHVRLVVLQNQCTGAGAYAGEQDDDPLNATDCASASDRDELVHAAELQVFGG